VFGCSRKIWAGFLVALALSAAALAQTEKTADEILSRARETVFKEGPRAALPELERALAICRKRNDRHGEAVTLGYLGFCYRQLAEYPRALEYLQRSLVMKQELGDRLEEGKSLNLLGLTYWDMGDYPQAIDHLTRALNIAREVHDPQLEGTALNNLGLVSDEQGDYKHSLEVYRQALDLHRSTHFERGESDTLGNIGGDYLLLGHYREALGYYQQALKADTRLQLKTSETIDLGDIALCQTGLGQLEEAVRTFDRALALAHETGQKKEEADWHKGKGAALLGLGKYDLARGEYQQALAAYSQAGQKRELIEALNEDGNLLAHLGDIPSAEKDFRRAIDLARAIGHPRGVTLNLMALADLEWRRQRYEQAAALYRQAFERAQDAEDRASMANSLVQLALTLRDQGQPEEASAQAQKALEITQQIGAKPLEAQALYVLGELARKRGDPRKALEHYTAGERLVEDTGSPELGWQLEYGKGQALEALQRNEEAVAAYRRAVEIIEGVTSQLSEERFQSGYIQDKYQVYVSLVRLLLKMGKTGEAFFFSEKLRARGYERLLNQNLPLGGDEAEVELRSRIRQLRRAIEEENAKPLAELKRQKVQVFTSELASAERRYQDLLDDRRRTRPADPAAQALAVPSSEQVRRALPAHAALIAYVVGQESVVIFALSRDEEHATTVPVSARNLRTKIELLRDLIAPGRGADWVKPAESLYQILIAPPEQNGWLKGITKLYLVPNAVLNYLPFAALARPDGEGVHLLVQDYMLAYLPAASALVYGPERQDSQRTLLALAPAKSRLRYAPQEARSISALFPDHSLLLLGHSATKSAFKRQASQFGLIHLATHGFFDKFNPIFSGIALEPEADDDGRLEVYEIMRLRLRARLVTLSACDTALGSGYFAEYPAGDDFVGLTRAFLYAGSSAVLASLWEVNDRSTMQIMSDFYRSLRETNSAEALAKAQRAMLASRGRFSRPYYWAPFIVMTAKN
jgi:CHAT domain-containing protein/Tfp pilus assembly protein PilF